MDNQEEREVREEQEELTEPVAQEEPEVPVEPEAQEAPEEPEFSLDDIMKEFAGGEGDTALPGDGEGDAPGHTAPEAEAPAVTGDTVRLDDIAQAVAAHPEEDAPETEEAPEAGENDQPPEEAPEPFSEEWEPEYDQPMGEYTPPAPQPIPFQPRQRLRELKRKLIAGPEKRYYDLCEMGVGKIQAAIVVNILIVVLCGMTAVLFATGGVGENRLRLMIFGQILAMLISALLGCYNIMEGVADLFKLRFSLNSMLFFTFLACCADGVLCLMSLRVPCCAAFSLEVTLALWNRYHNRSIEMGQMDTLRKASRLDSVVKVPEYYAGKPGILRGEGQPEDFMDNYTQTSGPEKVQRIFAFAAFLSCIGVAVLAGLRHGWHYGIQIFATSLLVATPAGFFVALSRPMAILERRLHMVGTVICGWQGVKALCGKAAFPVSDKDLFPAGTARLNGVKFYGDRAPDDVIASASALIASCGGTLVNVFQQLRVSRGCPEWDVENFRDYGSGGIGGEVNGEPVLMGTMDFLQDMGVEIPQGTMVSQAVYCSIDGELSAVFAINYSRMRSAAAGLISLWGCRKVQTVVVSDDFMLTDSFMRGKFSVRTRRMSFPDRQQRQELSAVQPTAEDRALALTTKDGLHCAVYAVSGARALRTASVLGLILHILAGVVGILMMGAIAYLGSAELLTPLNILLYQLVWLIPGLLVGSWTRTV